MKHSVLETELMACCHIHYDHKEQIKGFTLANRNGGYLADYLHKAALSDEEQSIMRTYLVFDQETKELAAYFSLKSGFVSAHENKRPFDFGFDSLPGVELANFAVNGKYKEAHPETRHLGAYVFREFVLPIVKNASDLIGIDILYIFALPYPGLIRYYEKMGFTRLNQMQEKAMHRRIRPNYDAGCIFMYRQL